MSATGLQIADKRVDDLHSAISTAVRAIDRLKRIEGELGEIRRDFDKVAGSIWDATMYDPDGKRPDEEAGAS